MQQWLAFPWVRYVIWLLCGILLALIFPGWEKLVQWLCPVAAVVYIGAVLGLKRNTPFSQISWGLLAFLFLSSLGYWRTAQALVETPVAKPDAPFWWVRVDEQPVATAKSYRFQAHIYPVQQEEVELSTNGTGTMVYVPNALPMPGAGQLLLVKGNLQSVAPPLNPHEFNYKDYLATQGVHYQLFVKQAAAVSTPQVFSFWQRTAIASRRYLLEVVSRFIPDPQATAVVQAMVLGQRSSLDSSLRQAYANAGVMHVLAVSGLHVGMVFGLVYMLFPFMRRQWWQRLLWLALVLAILWIYAWLTGLAPSAQRAAAMFTIIAISKAIRRRGNIYNSIALSAFILLLWNPVLLRQVGFQLSYLAVIGIIYLQPRIKEWWEPKQLLTKKFWELMSVTLAAQLATFPLGLYYFKQFPTYFFIGNLWQCHWPF